MADRPVHEIRLGKVKAAIWRNEGEFGTRHNVTFSKIFKTETGWDSSSSFGRDDLPLVTKVSDMAHLWIYQHAGNDSGDVENNGNSSSEPRNGKLAAAR